MWLVRAYQPVVTMGFWMMGKLKTRIVIGYIFA
jgi:glycerol uptake facilitator-like aquaporin